MLDPMAPNDEDFFVWDWTAKLAGDTISGNPTFSCTPPGVTAAGFTLTGGVVTWTLLAPLTTGRFMLGCTIHTSNGRILTRSAALTVGGSSS